MTGTLLRSFATMFTIFQNKPQISSFISHILGKNSQFDHGFHRKHTFAKEKCQYSSSFLHHKDFHLKMGTGGSNLSPCNTEHEAKVNPTVAIGIPGATPSDEVQRLSENLGLPIEKIQDLSSEKYHFSLQFNSDGALGIHCHTSRFSPLYVDFVHGKLGYRGCRPEHESILKAVQMKSTRTPTVWDMTAGLGRDSFILACGGCKVHLWERSPVIGAILADGLRRLGKEQTSRSQEIFERMSLTIADSAHLRPGDEVLNGVFRPQVAYIDPMFPKKDKSSLAKKDMQILQRLVGVGGTEEELFYIAMQICLNKVVVKRPIKGEYIAMKAPSHTIKGKSNRFDVYVK